MKVVKYNTILEDASRMVSLVKEKAINYIGEYKIKEPETVAKMLNEVFNMSRLTEEYFYLICCTLQGIPIGVFEIGHGSIDSSIVEVRSIMQKALLTNASCIIVAHNHPSGESTPSYEDIRITERLQEACKIMGIQFWDHIICGDNDFTSIKATMNG